MEPYVTVVVKDLSRESVEAMLEHVQKIPSTYTPLGVAAEVFTEAMREALVVPEPHMFPGDDGSDSGGDSAA